MITTPAGEAAPAVSAGAVRLPTPSDTICRALLSDPGLFRSRRGFGLAYERPESVSEETIDAYLAPLVASPEKAAAFDRFVLSLDPEVTTATTRELPAAAAYRA